MTLARLLDTRAWPPRSLEPELWADLQGLRELVGQLVAQDSHLELSTTELQLLRRLTHAGTGDDPDTLHAALAGAAQLTWAVVRRARRHGRTARRPAPARTTSLRRSGVGLQMNPRRGESTSERSTYAPRHHVRHRGNSNR